MTDAFPYFLRSYQTQELYSHFSISPFDKHCP